MKKTAMRWAPCCACPWAWGTAAEFYRFIVDPAAMTALDDGIHVVRQVLAMIKPVEAPPKPLATHLPPIKALPPRQMPHVAPPQQKKSGGQNGVSL